METTFSEEVAKRLGPLPQTEEEFYGVNHPRPYRRPEGYKNPAWFVHIRYPIKVHENRWPHRVIGTKEGVVKPRGHQHCNNVKDAYALAYSLAENMDSERQVEIRAKLHNRDKPQLVTIIQGRKGKKAKGLAALEV